MREQFAAGIAWGQAKKELHALINTEISDARERYMHYMENLDEVEAMLLQGAEKARSYSQPLLSKVRERIGIRALNR